MGEFWGGVIKEWIIVDVLFGIECVRMDGKGGGSIDIIWFKYSGVCRIKFIFE